MTTFDQREQAFEAKFARDEEIQFLTKARRNKLVGLWAAEKLGKRQDDAETFAHKIVLSDLARGTGDDVVRTIVNEFEAAGVGAAEPEVRLQMERLFHRAEQEIRHGL
jgi:hypothetical protein